MLKDIQCDICASDCVRVINTIAIGREDAPQACGDYVRLVRCRGCGLLYVNPQPVFLRLDAQDLYSEAYFSKEYMRFYGEGGVGAAQTNESFAWRLDVIGKYKTKGTLLDIGCATGGFLAAAKQRGWDVTGVEISKYAADRAAKECACTIMIGNLEEARFKDSFFDVVCAGDVLEHVISPSVFLSEVLRVLKDDGILYIAVPNAASFYYAFFGLMATINHKNYFVLPHHLYHFSPETLKKLLDKTGFELAELRFSHSRNPSWWMGIFNFHDRIVALARKKK